MKVIITSSALPIPAGTIMDVGAEIPAAWRGKCVPYVEEPKRRIVSAVSKKPESASPKRD